MATRFRYRQAIGQRELRRNPNRRMRCQSGRETGSIGRLDPNDLQTRLQRLQDCRHPGQETTSSHRNENCLRIWYLLENLKGQGALTRDNLRIVKRMNVGQVAFPGESCRLDPSFIESLAV